MNQIVRPPSLNEMIDALEFIGIESKGWQKYREVHQDKKTVRALTNTHFDTPQAPLSERCIDFIVKSAIIKQSLAHPFNDLKELMMHYRNASQISPHRFFYYLALKKMFNVGDLCFLLEMIHTQISRDAFRYRLFERYENLLHQIFVIIQPFSHWEVRKKLSELLITFIGSEPTSASNILGVGNQLLPYLNEANFLILIYKKVLYRYSLSKPERILFKIIILTLQNFRPLEALQFIKRNLKKNDVLNKTAALGALKVIYTFSLDTIAQSLDLTKGYAPYLAEYPTIEAIDAELGLEQKTAQEQLQLKKKNIEEELLKQLDLKRKELDLEEEAIQKRD